MFARVLKIHLKLDRVDDAVRLFKNNVLPLCRKQAGFKAAFFMADRKSGAGTVITLWRNEESMQATERNQFFIEQVTKFIGFYTMPPVRESYEIGVEIIKSKG